MLYHWAMSTLYADKLKSRVGEGRKIRTATCVYFPVAILFSPKSSHLAEATLACLGQRHHSSPILYPSGLTWFKDNTQELPGFFRLFSSGTSIRFQCGSHNGAQAERLSTWNWTVYISIYWNSISSFWSEKNWNQEGSFVVVVAVNEQKEESGHRGTSQGKAK